MHFSLSLEGERERRLSDLAANRVGVVFCLSRCFIVSCGVGLFFLGGVAADGCYCMKIVEFIFRWKGGGR